MWLADALFRVLLTDVAGRSAATAFRSPDEMLTDEPRGLQVPEQRGPKSSWRPSLKSSRCLTERLRWRKPWSKSHAYRSRRSWNSS